MAGKKIKPWLILVLLISVMTVFFACVFSSDPDSIEETEEVYLESIRVDRSTIPETLYAGNVDLGQISLILTYSDGTQETESLSEDHIAIGSRNKLKKIGTQQLEIVYGNCTTSLQLELVDPTITQYKLVIEGGVPVSVDGEQVSVIAPSDGVYTGYFVGGTVVVVSWTEEENKVFGTWMSDGESVDNQMTTTIHMNSDHSYTAVSYDVVYTVNFITFKDNYNIASKNIQRLYSYLSNYDRSNLYYAEIPSMTMDNYVFTGWTSQEITRDESLSGSGEIPLVDFSFYDNDYNNSTYLKVSSDLTLYAVWTPIRLDCSPYTPSITGYTHLTGCQVVKYEGTLTDLVIPATWNGLPVLSISNQAFTERNAAYINSITIPASVIEIEEGAFMYCSALKNIYVEQGSPIFSSENGVLYKDERTNIVAYPANKVSRLYEMESGVFAISAYAFYNAVVGQIVVATDISEIGDHAFDSVHIDTIDFSSTAVSRLSSIQAHIGDNIFNDNISTIILTSNDAEWGAFAALNCFGDFTDRFSDGSDIHRLYTYYYTSDIVILFRIISGTDLAEHFINTGSTAEIIGISRQLTDIIVPERLFTGTISYSVSSIGYYAFKDCVSLKNVVLPSTLERVCDKAFDDTIWVNSISETIIANETLYKYLGSSDTVNLPSGIKKIAESAFRNNTSLRFLNITSNTVLEHICAFAFSGCANLTSFSDTKNDGNLLIKPALKRIDDYAFFGTNILHVISEENSTLEHIGEYAFSECNYILSVDFSSAVLHEIDTTSFYNTESLLSYHVAQENDIFVSYNDVLYQMTSGNTATLFAYPSGKLCDEFNPSEFRKKYVPVSNGKFVVYEHEYTVNPSLSTESTLVGSYVEEDNGVSLGTYTYNLAKESEDVYYVPVTVNSIGEYALFRSNIGAIVFEEAISESSQIMVPGLVYLKIITSNLTSMNYSSLFREKQYEPGYVWFTSLPKQNVMSFFNSNSSLSDEKYVSSEPVKFFMQGNNLYYYRQGVVTLSRTPRDEYTLTVPEVVAYDETDYGRKNIGSYAFGGWYLNEIVIERGADVIYPSAMGLTHLLKKVYLNEDDTTKLPSVSKTSFGNNFEKGLLIYIKADTSDAYIEEWNEKQEENILQVFEYDDIGFMRVACPYLIEENAFAVLTYRDDNGDLVTVGHPIYTQINSINIRSFYNTVRKDGYVIGGWTNEYGETVSFDNGYAIPYNQVLTCVWEPRVYTIYLYVNTGYDVPGAEYSTQKKMYVTTVQYHSAYEWTLTGYDEKYQYLKQWNYQLSSGTGSVPVKGVWNLSLDTEADSGNDIVFTANLTDRVFILTYKCEGDLSNRTKEVKYNQPFELDIPVKTGYTFDGWYFVDVDSDALTDASGESIGNWTFTFATNDMYDIKPKWVANVITVNLYKTDRFELEEDVIYKTVTVVYDSNSYAFTLDENGDVFSAEELGLFSGWADENGVIYTDTDGYALQNRKWDKDGTTDLYTVWPVSVSTLNELISALEGPTGSMSASIVLAADITIDSTTMPDGHKLSFGTTDLPYTGVFNGAGYTITYENKDNSSPYCGLFVKNEGTIKNLNFTVKSIDRNISTGTYGQDNPIYFGTICAINNGYILNVNLIVEEMKVTVNSKEFCFYDFSDAYHIGVICADNTGTITGNCTYYESNVVYYSVGTVTALNYYESNQWRRYYSDFYTFSGNSFNVVTPPYDEDIEYYVLDANNDYLIATDEAEEYYLAGEWDKYYAQFYIEGEVYTQVKVPFYDTLEYYTKLGDNYSLATTSAKEDYQNGDWDAKYNMQTGQWEGAYSKYYTKTRYNNTDVYIVVSAPYSSSVDYYKKSQDGNSYVLSNQDADDDKESGAWDSSFAYAQYYNKSNGFIMVSVLFDDEQTYYMQTSDIFTQEKLLKTGNLTNNKMNITIINYYDNGSNQE